MSNAFVPTAGEVAAAATWRTMEKANRDETWERMSKEERLVLLNAYMLLPPCLSILEYLLKVEEEKQSVSNMAMEKTPLKKTWAELAGGGAAGGAAGGKQSVSAVNAAITDATPIEYNRVFTTREVMNPRVCRQLSTVCGTDGCNGHTNPAHERRIRPLDLCSRCKRTLREKLVEKYKGCCRLCHIVLNKQIEGTTIGHINSSALALLGCDNGTAWLTNEKLDETCGPGSLVDTIEVLILGNHTTHRKFLSLVAPGWETRLSQTMMDCSSELSKNRGVPFVTKGSDGLSEEVRMKRLSDLFVEFHALPEYHKP